MTPESWVEVHRALERISPLGREVSAELQALATGRHMKKGDHLLRAGDQARNVLFVRKGLLREYYVDGEGEEATRRFCAQGDFSGSLADLISRAPAAVSIECLEAGEFLLRPPGRQKPPTERGALTASLGHAGHYGECR